PTPSPILYNIFFTFKGYKQSLQFSLQQHSLNLTITNMAMSKAKDLVSSNSVVVFSKSYCPYCTQVKKLLDQLKATYKAVELDKESA
ncbi:unnamed protein product, partial [Linum perenne]